MLCDGRDWLAHHMRFRVPISGEKEGRTAPSTCQVGPAGCRRLAVGSGILLPTGAIDFRPDLECLGPGSPMLGGSDVVAAKVEEVVDLIVG